MCLSFFNLQNTHTLFTGITMARTNSRSSRMDKVFGIRMTEKDIAELKLHAQKRGVDVSTLIRMTLIDRQLLSPL